ncbi:MAG: peptide deformylase [bacterium]|nr:peptide deformylase [bacterium]
MRSAHPGLRLYGDPVLRRRAAPVVADAAKTGALLDSMWRILGEAGVGLAAPQIGHSVRVLVVHDPREDEGRRSGGKRYELINPELVESFGERQSFEEGCLSFPGLYVRVWRPRGVVVSYEDRTGRRHELRDDGLVARIVRHELDHLDGKLFIDRLPRWRRLLLAPRLLGIRRRGRRGGDEG